MASEMNSENGDMVDSRHRKWVQNGGIGFGTVASGHNLSWIHGSTNTSGGTVAEGFQELQRLRMSMMDVLSSRIPLTMVTVTEFTANVFILHIGISCLLSGSWLISNHCLQQRYHST